MNRIFFQDPVAHFNYLRTYTLSILPILHFLKFRNFNSTKNKPNTRNIRFMIPIHNSRNRYVIWIIENPWKNFFMKTKIHVKLNKYLFKNHFFLWGMINLPCIMNRQISKRHQKRYVKNFSCLENLSSIFQYSTIPFQYLGSINSKLKRASKPACFELTDYSKVVKSIHMYSVLHHKVIALLCNNYLDICSTIYCGKFLDQNT